MRLREEGRGEGEEEGREGKELAMPSTRASKMDDLWKSDIYLLRLQIFKNLQNFS